MCNSKYLPKEVEAELRRLGMGPEDHLGEYWFSNRTEVTQKIRKWFSDVEIQKIESRIRWFTPMGQACLRQVREHICAKIERVHQLHNEAFR